MRILINALPMLGRLTGIGQYIRQLTHSLHTQFTDDHSSQADDTDHALGLFNGSTVLDYNEFFTSQRQSDRVDRIELIRAISNYVPFRRALIRMKVDRSARRIDGNQWDLYHEPNYVPIAFDKPLVITACDMSVMRHPHHHPADRVAWFRERFPESLQRAEQIITISQFSKDELLDCFPYVDPSRVHVTHMGIDHSHWKPASDSAKRTVADRYGLPERFILYVGTLEPRKNLAGLLQAYQQLPIALREEHPLVIVGASGWQNADIKAQLGQLVVMGEANVLGYVPDGDLPALVSSATCFCYPSLYEGFGLPPLEAAACGTPVICSDAGSLPEVMGRSATYVKPSDPADLAHALQSALEHAVDHKQITRGIQHAKAFTWTKCADQTLDVYRMALGQSIPQPIRRAA